MSGYIGSKAVNLSTTGADINGDAIVDGTLDVLGAATGTDLTLSGGVYLGGTGAANYMSDYEEGTFTPILAFNGGTIGITYSVQIGQYTKVGNVVTAVISIDLSSKGTDVGSAVIVGLPFTVGTQPSVGGMFMSQVSFADYPFAFFRESSTQVELFESSNAGTLSAITNGNVVNASAFKITCTYRT
jgi:hypothetical protein